MLERFKECERVQVWGLTTCLDLHDYLTPPPFFFESLLPELFGFMSTFSQNNACTILTKCAHENKLELKRALLSQALSPAVTSFAN